MEFEIEIIKNLQAITSQFFDGFCKLISIFANYAGFAFVFIFLFLFINKKFSVFFGLTYSFSIGINYALKYIINRPRPYMVDNTILNIMSGHGPSMPSGHTVSVTIISCFCLFAAYKLIKNKYLKTILTILFMAFVGLTILSRMYLGQHYLTDTIAGLTEGLIFSTVGIIAYIKNEKSQQNIK